MLGFPIANLPYYIVVGHFSGVNFLFFGVFFDSLLIMFQIIPIFGVFRKLLINILIIFKKLQAQITPEK